MISTLASPKMDAGLVRATHPQSDFSSPLNTSAALERLHKNITLLAESLNRAIDISGRHLTCDPRNMAEVGKSGATPETVKSAFAQAVEGEADRVNALFVLCQQFGSNIDA